MDFSSSLAEKLGARFSGDKLTLKIFGKDFSVNSKGNLSSDIHMHRWVTIPVLSYIIKALLPSEYMILSLFTAAATCTLRFSGGDTLHLVSHMPDAE